MVADIISESVKSASVVVLPVKPSGSDNVTRNDQVATTLPCDAGPCPVVCLGHLDGRFYFLDARGQIRALTARQVGNREELMALFLDEGIWLTAAFPCYRKQPITNEQGEVTGERLVVADFKKNTASAWLMRQCSLQGLFGTNVVVRKPGIWSDYTGNPVVHCGDVVIMSDGAVKRSGLRQDNQIWAAAPPELRPDRVAGPEIAQKLAAQIRELWNFKRSGSDIVLMGWLACAYLGAAIQWRPAAFLVGGAGSGKSSLLEVIRAACPLNAYSNNTTRAGLEQFLNGRAVPSFIDEAADQDDQRNARNLIDLVVAASGGDGAQGLRGGSDGIVRRVEVCGSILMASISPPDLSEQHLGRFTIIDLDRASAGADHRSEHKKLRQWAQQHGAGLWARALNSWDRLGKVVETFRGALRSLGCLPRDNDQLSALLAGYWILCFDNIPELTEASGFCEEASEFIRDADTVLIQSASAQLANCLLSQVVQVQRSTDRRTISDLINRVLRKAAASIDMDNTLDSNVAAEVLAQYGIRVIRADDTQPNRSGIVAPRAGAGAGIWVWSGATALRGLFRDHPAYRGQKLEYELKRFETARQYSKQLRIGPFRARNCIWIACSELGISETGNEDDIALEGIDHDEKTG